MHKVMEEQLWYAQQQSRVLREFRENIQGLWNDEASRELNTRYLNPHEEDDKQMLGHLQSQLTSLNLSSNSLVAAQQNALKAEKLSLECVETLKLAEEDSATAEQFYEQHRNYLVSAQGRFSEIERLIAQANHACNGVATS
jgi:hypothetical protein